MRRFKLLPLVFCAIYLLGTIIGGIGLAEMAVHPGRRPIPVNEEKQIESDLKPLNANLQDVSISASDGALLRGWFLRPASGNGNAIIVLHGVSDNRLGMYGYGEWLLRNGYSVLLPDAGAHGLSGGELATYGLEEPDDIHRWVNWLEERATTLRLRLWRIYGSRANSTGAHAVAPEEFDRRILSWFSEHSSASRSLGTQLAQ